MERDFGYNSRHREEKIVYYLNHLLLGLSPASRRQLSGHTMRWLGGANDDPRATTTDRGTHDPQPRSETRL